MFGSYLQSWFNTIVNFQITLYKQQLLLKQLPLFPGTHSCHSSSWPLKVEISSRVENKRYILGYYYLLLKWQIRGRVDNSRPFHRGEANCPGCRSKGNSWTMNLCLPMVFCQANNLTENVCFSLVKQKLLSWLIELIEKPKDSN